MSDYTIGFVGGGNMARSLIGGLLHSGWPSARIRVSEPETGRRDALATAFAVATTADNTVPARQAQVVVLAVKPQRLREVCLEIAGPVAEHRPLVLSIAAGVRETDLGRWLGGTPAIVRAMPNTPALVGSGAAGLYANAQVDPTGRERAESILRAVGACIWVDREELLDVVTALSGSGPAYFLYVMEALEQAAVDLGLREDAARLLTLETALGTAKLALESDEDPGRLRARVTSPGGTTEAALAVLDQHHAREALGAAVRAARERAAALARQLGRA